MKTFILSLMLTLTNFAFATEIETACDSNPAAKMAYDKNLELIETYWSDMQKPRLNKNEVMRLAATISALRSANHNLIESCKAIAP